MSINLSMLFVAVRSLHAMDPDNYREDEFDLVLKDTGHADGPKFHYSDHIFDREGAIAEFVLLLGPNRNHSEVAFTEPLDEHYAEKAHVEGMSWTHIVPRADADSQP